MKVRQFLAALGLAVLTTSATAQTPPTLEVFKSPYCGCCGQWVEHMKKAGFKVKINEVTDISASRRQLGMPEKYGSCHTARIGNYLVEGHVPAADVKKLLREKPKAVGIAVPGMPLGSPGMESVKPMPYQTLLVQSNGDNTVFAQH